jgi:hypothetical protein
MQNLVQLVVQGGNTLQGAQIVVTLHYFFKGPMFELQPWHYYEGFSKKMFLPIMVSQNPNKSNSKKTTFFNLIWYDVRIYVCQKNLHHNILKNANILQKWLKWLLVFVKFVISIKHYNTIWLE